MATEAENVEQEVVPCPQDGSANPGEPENVTKWELKNEAAAADEKKEDCSSCHTNGHVETPSDVPAALAAEDCQATTEAEVAEEPTQTSTTDSAVAEVAQQDDTDARLAAQTAALQKLHDQLADFVDDKEEGATAEEEIKNPAYSKVLDDMLEASVKSAMKRTLKSLLEPKPQDKERVNSLLHGVHAELLQQLMPMEQKKRRSFSVIHSELLHSVVKKTVKSVLQELLAPKKADQEKRSSILLGLHHELVKAVEVHTHKVTDAVETPAAVEDTVAAASTTCDTPCEVACEAAKETSCEAATETGCEPAAAVAEAVCEAACEAACESTTSDPAVTEDAAAPTTEAAATEAPASAGEPASVPSSDCPDTTPCETPCEAAEEAAPASTAETPAVEACAETCAEACAVEAPVAEQVAPTTDADDTPAAAAADAAASSPSPAETAEQPKTPRSASVTIVEPEPTATPAAADAATTSTTVTEETAAASAAEEASSDTLSVDSPSKPRRKSLGGKVVDFVSNLFK